MKKLMMAVAIVCAAVYAQAGYVTWSAANVKYSGTALSAGHVYAFFFTSEDAANTAIGSFGSDMTLDAFKTAVGSANWNDSKKATAAGSFNVNTSSAAGSYSKDALANANFGLSDSTEYWGFLVFTDKDPVADGAHFAASQVVKQKTAGSSVTGANFAFGDQTNTASKAWHAVAAPEPSSALLMLLGLGAMALRRRRA